MANSSTKKTEVSRGTRVDLVDKPAGSFDKTKGRVKIDLFGKNYMRSRLIYTYFNGDFDGQIDHINGDRVDDRIENLRLATPTENARNKALVSNNKTRVRNVYPQANGKFTVRVGISKKIRNFGTYDNLELAELVAEEVREKYFGEFAGYGK